MKKSNRKPNRGHVYQQPRDRNYGYRVELTEAGPVWTNQHPFVATENRSRRSITREFNSRAAMLVAAEFQRLDIARRNAAAAEGKKVKWRLEEAAAIKLFRTAQANVNAALEAYGKRLAETLAGDGQEAVA